MTHKVKETVLITGSSGFVASDLIPKINDKVNCIGIDSTPGKYTSITDDISNFRDHRKKIESDTFSIINLASIRSDFGISAKKYFEKNVTNHSKFLNELETINIKKFIHISSVAAFDGKDILFSEELNCDDAYRSTKFLQEKLILKWCIDRKVDLFILYPSAIFSINSNLDTNIGKLQTVSKLFPIVPEINVIKTLSFLPNISKFISDSLFGDILPGKYLSIDEPSLTVTKIIQGISSKNLKLIRIPFLKSLLKVLAFFLYIFGFFGKIDMKLTPNRVTKLFRDTSYSNIDSEEVDTKTYSSRNKEKLVNILEKINQEK